MKIKYVFHDHPEREKEVDFDLLYEQYEKFHSAFFDGEKKTKEEWEKEELERLKKKVKKGIILSYRIVD